MMGTSETNSPMATLVYVSRAWCETNAAGKDALNEVLRGDRGDGVVLEGDGTPRGVFRALAVAARADRLLLPGCSRPALHTGSPLDLTQEQRIFWIARGDHALHHLLMDEDPLASGDDVFDEPIALLGVPGDVVCHGSGFDGHLRRQRADQWIRRLGRHRVVLAVRAGDPNDAPLLALAADRGLPVVALATPEDALPPGQRALPPFLNTSFQMDREHRLPDDAFVPGLRDLLHRGSLLRERTLYDRLPAPWRDVAEAELRALYSWHVSPLLRRATMLVQTLLPLADTRVETPLPEVRGVLAYLLGLTDRRPNPEIETTDPVETARQLAAALAGWDRRLVAEVGEDSWPRLASRLLPWSEGGLLAACPDTPHRPGRRFCFSGEPLWKRTRLGRDSDGVASVDLEAQDRRALGWFELELLAGHASSSRPGGALAPVAELTFPGLSDVDNNQLELDLGVAGA